MQFQAATASLGTGPVTFNGFNTVFGNVPCADATVGGVTISATATVKGFR